MNFVIAKTIEDAVHNIIESGMLTEDINTSFMELVERCHATTFQDATCIGHYFAQHASTLQVSGRQIARQDESSLYYYGYAVALVTFG